MLCDSIFPEHLLSPRTPGTEPSPCRARSSSGLFREEKTGDSNFRPVLLGQATRWAILLPRSWMTRGMLHLPVSTRPPCTHPPPPGWGFCRSLTLILEPRCEGRPSNLSAKRITIKPWLDFQG